MEKRGADMHSLEEVISALQKGKILAPKYNDHQLKGKYSKFRECHVGPDWLLLCLIDREILTLTLVKQGVIQTVSNRSFLIPVTTAF